MQRPGPLRWLWYAFGGRLPWRYHDWVLRDVTARGWWWRSLLRSFVQVLPIGVLIFLFLPVELWVRVAAAIVGMAVGLTYALAYLDEAAESRALKAGWTRGKAKAVREERRAGERAAREARYSDRYRNPPRR